MLKHNQTISYFIPSFSEKTDWNLFSVSCNIIVKRERERENFKTTFYDNQKQLSKMYRRYVVSTLSTCYCQLSSKLSFIKHHSRQHF